MKSSFVEIVEVGPRDGIQNEKAFIDAEDKIRLIDLLSKAGLSRIEATSFVSAKWIPQLADASEVLRGIKRFPGVRYAALTPNLQGYQSARQCAVNEVAVFASASEAFSKKNINCAVMESLERFQPVIEMALRDGVPVRGYVSCVIACPYQGAVCPDDVARLTEELIRMGCHEISLGDTIGAGTPETINEMLKAVLDVARPDVLAGHYHDTRDMALPNIGASLEMNIRKFDTSISGLGGCPYAPGAKGNADTRTVVAWLHGHGYQTGINEEKLIVAENFVSGIIPGKRRNACSGPLSN